MNAPGSPSSALQTTYFGESGALRMISHFLPVGKPAPPRPRRPLALISSITCWGVIAVSTLPSAAYPSRAMYSSMFSGSMMPQLSRTMRSWELKKVKSACVITTCCVLGSCGSSLV